MRPRIYISGPITQGDRNHNVYQAMHACRQLMLDGFAPLNPIASCCYPFAWEPDMQHDLWIACDLAWVAVADAVYRLPGESAGADAEVAFAKERGIPVFSGRYDLLQYWKHERDRDERKRREAIESGGAFRSLAAQCRQACGRVFRIRGRKVRGHQLAPNNGG